MTIQEKEQDIIDEFSFYQDWMEKYEYIIELGKDLPVIDEQYKTEDNLVKGCQSKVWLHGEMDGDKVKYFADSDAVITKGIVSLLIRVFSGSTPEEIIHSDLRFVDEIGLKEHLSMNRANGLVSMIKQMKTYALAYSAK